jgi:hypothetical protein
MDGMAMHYERLVAIGAMPSALVSLPAEQNRVWQELLDATREYRSSPKDDRARAHHEAALLRWEAAR